MRLGYIDKEKDRKSKLGDHTSTSLSAGGVRKYDYEIGRFASVYPLWEKYVGWTGYQYSLNKINGDISCLIIKNRLNMNVDLSHKEIAVKLISEMPGESTIEDIMYLLYIQKKFFDGLTDIYNGEVLNHSDVQLEFKEWLE